MAELKVVPCKYCGKPTISLGTKLCDKCWELDHRIIADPEIVTAILQDNPAIRDTVVKILEAHYEYKYPKEIIVMQTIWLALEELEGEVIGWTPDEPEFHNEQIEANTILTFDHVCQGCQGCGCYKPYGEFNEEDLRNLSNSGSIMIEIGK